MRKTSQEKLRLSREWMVQESFPKRTGVEVSVLTVRDEVSREL